MSSRARWFLTLVVAAAATLRPPATRADEGAGIPFHHGAEGYPRALADARARGVPLLIEAHVPW